MNQRVKNSFGKYHYNKGNIINQEENRFTIDNSREYYLFDVIPMGAVRMTQSDRWKTNPNHIDPKKRQRKNVKQYFDFKNLLVAQANLMKFEIGECLEAIYFLPMPNSWSEKKKEKMNGFPCKVKPDTDNITKAIKDALLKNDSCVWWEKAEKRWAYKGSILIYK